MEGSGPSRADGRDGQVNLGTFERDDGRLDVARDVMRDAIETLPQLGATQEVATGSLGRLANVLGRARGRRTRGAA